MNVLYVKQYSASQELLKKNNTFTWDEAVNQAFQQLKPQPSSYCSGTTFFKQLSPYRQICLAEAFGT